MNRGIRRHCLVLISVLVPHGGVWKLLTAGVKGTMRRMRGGGGRGGEGRGVLVSFALSWTSSAPVGLFQLVTPSCVQRATGGDRDLKRWRKDGQR